MFDYLVVGAGFAGSVRAERCRHGAHSGADQSRRSVLHGQVPGYAAIRIHANVRAAARSSQHQNPAQYRLPGNRRPGAIRPDGLHGSHRRVLGVPVWQAPLPLADFPASDRQRGAAPAGGKRSGWSACRTPNGESFEPMLNEGESDSPEVDAPPRPAQA